MAVPRLLTTGVHNETYGGVTYHIDGELVPVLQVELSSMPVFFEHHILLWKDTDSTVAMETKIQTLRTGLFASAGQVIWNRFTGPRRVALQSMYVHEPTTT